MPVVPDGRKERFPFDFRCVTIVLRLDANLAVADTYDGRRGWDGRSRRAAFTASARRRLRRANRAWLASARTTPIRIGWMAPAAASASTRPGTNQTQNIRAQGLDAWNRAY